MLWLGSMASVRASGPSELIITESTTLDPNQTYSRIIIQASNITLDGQGEWLIGKTEGKPSEYQGTAIVARKNKVNVLAQIHQRRRDRLARWPIRYVVGGEQVLSH